LNWESETACTLLKLIRRRSRQQEFNSKTVFITGGGAGIGKACALAFATNGARVTVADISGEAAGKVAEQICSAGGEAMILTDDFSQAEQVADMVASVVTTWGALDIAVNNAGISTPILPLAETLESDFDRVMAVNLKGVWLCMRAELAQMFKQGSGNVVNMASALSKRVYEGASFYVASKFSVAGMTRTAAVKYAQAGIRINAICPSNVRTPLLEKSVKPDAIAQLAALQAMNRPGTPEEIANAVLWVASAKASFCTGTMMSVDGGWTAS
jgi:NAD(P)-dependent dehydrogenase (short-subunit alcohol dehydrogenase family)